MSTASMQAYHKKSFESYVSYRRTGGYGPGDSKNGVSCRIPIRRNMGNQKGSRAMHLMGVHLICMHLTGRVAQKAGTGEL